MFEVLFINRRFWRAPNRAGAAERQRYLAHREPARCARNVGVLRGNCSQSLSGST